MLNLSGPQVALGLIFAVGWGVLGYFLTETDRRRLGRTPWGVPPFGWSAILFVSGLIGFILWLIAHRSAVRQATQGPSGGPVGGPRYPQGHAAAPHPGRASASDFPAYPRPASGGDRPRRGANGVPPTPPPPPPTPPPPPPTSDVAPPGWHPDPGGHFHYRWWTGSEWTSYVATDGRVEVDTSPDQRIGPY